MSMDPEIDRKQKREHYEKYEKLAREFEGYDLPSYVPATKERIEGALASGDEHLNTIPLGAWDRAAQIHYATGVERFMLAMPGERTEPCPTCGHPRKVMDPPKELWRNFHHATKDGRRAFYSLSDRVCLLKHVARYWIAGATPPE